MEHAVYSDKKVLLITNDLGPRAGGIETFVLGLIEGLPKNSLTIYTSSQKGDKAFDAQLLEKFGAVVIRDRAKILLPTPRITRRAVKILKQQEIKNVWFGAAAPLALMAGTLRSAGANNIVALTHGHEVWWAKIPLLRNLLKKIIKDVDHLGYLGGFTKGEIAKISNQPQKFLQIAPGIDTDHFAPRSARGDLIEKYRLDGRRVIVSVGRLVHRKGQDELVKAMPKILEQFPDAILLFVGEGPIKQMLFNSAKQLGVLPKVVFAGRVSHHELPDYICLGEIFAMPVRSRFAGLEVEGLGIVYLEASACGLPVIVGNSGGAVDAVLDKKTGLLVDGTKSDQIADAICELFANPERAKQMGAAGRDWVINNWQLSNWSTKFNKVLIGD
ncbi:MAG: glycosyltransferase family 4 protein [Candidatus Nanopelagicus sp.]